MSSFLAGLGTALQTGGALGLDEKQRLRALQAAASQFEEQKRHNSALEAFNQAQLAMQKEDRDRLRARQDIETFTGSAEKAGYAYLDPQKAYETSKPMEQQVSMGGMDAMPDISPAVNALKTAATTGWQKNIDPTMSSMRDRNVSSGLIPGSEVVGGVVAKNQAFNPNAYLGAQYRGGVAENSAEDTAFAQAQDDIRIAAADAYKNIKDMATDIEKITNTADVERRAVAAREAQRKRSAQAWSTRLQNRFPGKATQFTVEALTGEAAAAPSAPQQGAPVTPQRPPAFDPNDPLGLGAPARPARPQARPNIPNTPQAPNFADPLGLFPQRPE